MGSRRPQLARNPSFRLPVSAALASIDGPSAGRQASIFGRWLATIDERDRAPAGRLL
jgi:hypothetical protein